MSLHITILLQVSTITGKTLIDQFKKEGVVCPPDLRHSVFTTGNLDNIDHNPSSNTSKTSFHGTALSLTNHLTYENMGKERAYEYNESNVLKQHLDDLHCEYSTVHYAVDNENPVPNSQLVMVDTISNENKLEKHLAWVKNHRKQCRIWERKCILPMFRDSAHTKAMVKHRMDVIKKSTLFLNPSQESTILVLDQPLFALAKKIQWENQKDCGEDTFVIMMGGLHIEMFFLEILGQFLDESG